MTKTPDPPIDHDDLHLTRGAKIFLAFIGLCGIAFFIVLYLVLKTIDGYEKPSRPAPQSRPAQVSGAFLFKKSTIDRPDFSASLSADSLN